jgi:Fe-S-cluster-containing dehydrogenase component
MNAYNGIIVDMDRCVGCYTCELACRKENNLTEDVSWIKVRKIGPQPLESGLAMDFVVSIAEDCTLCNHRLEKGLKPICVSTCPTEALIYCGTHELLSNIRKSRIQIAKMKTLGEGIEV